MRRTFDTHEFILAGAFVLGMALSLPLINSLTAVGMPLLLAVAAYLAAWASGAAICVWLRQP